MHATDAYSICIGYIVSLRYGTLGLLAEGPLHGYEIKNRFEELLGGTWDVNIGQVYATLARLERDGLVEPHGPRGDRRKLPYRLTSGGRAELERWIETPENEPQALRQEIYVKLLLAGRVSNGRLEPLLHGQRRIHLQRLKELADLERGARDEHRDDLALLLRGARLHAEADLKWIDELIADPNGKGATGEREDTG